jgi:O-antigen/teichoic acid export membrane protein
MNKAVAIGKVSVKGCFHVMWGLVASTVISAVGTVLIALLLGAENYGLYSIALTGPLLIDLFRDWGISNAVIRYTAQSNAENKTAHIKSIFISGLLFEVAVGITLSIFGLLLSGFLATSVFNRPNITPLIQMASFIVLANALVYTATAAFTGIEKLHLNSIMLVSQSVIKTTIIVILLVLGFGTIGAVTGFTVSSFLAGLIGLTLMFTVYRKLPNLNEGKREIGQTLKTMLRYGMPLSIGNIIGSAQGGLMVQYYNFLVYSYVADNTLIGNLAMAQKFVVLIIFFATPITTMLFPAFSKLDYKKDPETLKNVFQASVKYSSLIVVPVAVMIMSLAHPAISTLFGNKYSEAPLFLALLAITYIYTVFGNLSTGSLIAGQGQTTFLLIRAIITAATGFPLGFILISNYGILGLIITTLTASLPSIFVSLIFIKKRYNVTVHWESSGKILLSSAIASIFTYILLAQLNTLTSLIQLTIGATVFILAYLISAILTKTFDTTDISNLREMFSALGSLRRIFNAIFNLIERLMTTLRVRHKQDKQHSS